VIATAGRCAADALSQVTLDLRARRGYTLDDVKTADRPASPSQVTRAPGGAGAARAQLAGEGRAA
jgi:hypothetical protein